MNLTPEPCHFHTLGIGRCTCEEKHPKTNCQDWDSAAEALGVEIGSFGYVAHGHELLGFDRPPGPSRLGSTLCRSGAVAAGGHRWYCTCDTCY